MIMRKPRAIIYDDDSTLLLLVKNLFTQRGYDVLAYQKPQSCPLYGEEADCENLRPCADVILSDYKMPGMTGTEMLREQSLRRCRVPAENRAIMSGYLDEKGRKSVLELGSVFFQKPFSFNDLSAWLEEREQLMDLSQPLGLVRREQRLASCEKVTLLASSANLINGVALNVSPSGLCLKIEAPLREGETLTIRPGLPRLSRTASVRWVREISRGLYMTGLQYEG
jgi:CheY-like chemotaxis protein